MRLVLVPGRRGHDDRRDRGRGRGARPRPPRASGGRRSAGTPSGVSAPSRVPAPAARMIAAACVSGSMRAACQTRAAAGNRAQVAAGSDAVASRVAKIIRPVVVWITLRTRTVTCEPIALGRVLDHDHRAVVEVPDRLTVIAALAHESHLRLVAGADRRAEARRERVDLRHGHPQRLGDERQVVVHRDQARRRSRVRAARAPRRRRPPRPLRSAGSARAATSAARPGRRGRDVRACAAGGRTNRRSPAARRARPRAPARCPR